MGLLGQLVGVTRLDVIVLAVLVVVGLAPWTAYLMRARRKRRRD